ncbi:MAG: FecR domain-containing protein [Sphingomonas sp.]
MARLDRLGGEESDHPELMRWLEADVRNRGAFARARALWLMLDSGRVLAAGHAAEEEERRPLVTRRAAMTGIAASAAVVTAGVILGSLPNEAKAFSTGVGEIKRFRLDDGSTMVLDTDSRVETRIDREHREVRLVAGGAWFEVPGESRHAVRRAERQDPRPRPGGVVRVPPVAARGSARLARRAQPQAPLRDRPRRIPAEERHQGDVRAGRRRPDRECLADLGLAAARMARRRRHARRRDGRLCGGDLQSLQSPQADRRRCRARGPAAGRPLRGEPAAGLRRGRGALVRRRSPRRWRRHPHRAPQKL